MRSGKIVFFAAGLFFFAGLMRAEAVTLARQANKDLKGSKAVSLNEILSLPEEEIDLATAVLILSLEAGEKISGRTKVLSDYTQFLDDQALKVWYRLQPEASAEAVLDEMAKVIFEELGFSAVDRRQSLILGGREADFLDEVIDRKQGNCLGLSLLYLGIAERLGFPLKGVDMPEHVIVRYESPEGRQINVETTAEGQRYEGMKIWQQDFGAQSGFPLNDKALSKREMLAVFMANAAIDYKVARRPKDAERVSLLAQSVSPDNPSVIHNLAVAYDEMGMTSRAVELLESFLARHSGESHELMAMNLGTYYVEMKEFAKAEKHFETLRLEMEKAAAAAVPADPGAVKGTGAKQSGLKELYAMLGNVYGHLQEYEKADFFLKKASELDPYDPRPFFDAGHNSSAQGKTKEAIENYKRAAGLDGEFAEAHYNLGVQYQILGDSHGAQYHFQRARDLGFAVKDSVFKSLKRPTLRSRVHEEKAEPVPAQEAPGMEAFFQEISKYGVSTADPQEAPENNADKKRAA